MAVTPGPSKPEKKKKSNALTLCNGPGTYVSGPSFRGKISQKHGRISQEFTPGHAGNIDGDDERLSHVILI